MQLFDLLIDGLLTSILPPAYLNYTFLHNVSYVDLIKKAFYLLLLFKLLLYLILFFSRALQLVGELNFLIHQDYFSCVLLAHDLHLHIFFLFLHSHDENLLWLYAFLSINLQLDFDFLF